MLILFGLIVFILTAALVPAVHKWDMEALRHKKIRIRAREKFVAKKLLVFAREKIPPCNSAPQCHRGKASAAGAHVINPCQAQRRQPYPILQPNHFFP